MKTNTHALPLTSFGGHARQGDTLLRRIPATPAGLKRTKGIPTLALGEKTFHHHSFTDGGAVAFADDERATLADAVQVTAPEAPLTHQEHETIVFPKGDYESLKQVEYTPEALRNVAD